VFDGPVAVRAVTRVLWVDRICGRPTPSTVVLMMLVDIAVCTPASGPEGQSSLLTETATTMPAEISVARARCMRLTLPGAFVGFDRRLFEGAGDPTRSNSVGTKRLPNCSCDQGRAHDAGAACGDANEVVVPVTHS
jgi:hypothetical protein